MIQLASVIRHPWTNAALKGWLFVVLVAAAFVAFDKERANGGKNAQEYTGRFQTELTQQRQKIECEKCDPLGTKLTGMAKQHLRDDARTSLLLAEAYLFIVQEQYKFYYASVLVSTVSGALAAMILVIISKEGWKSTNDYLMIAFAVFSIASATFGLAPGVFRYAENIDGNESSFLDCMNIEHDILAFAATYDPKGHKEDVNHFVTEVGSRLKAARQLRFEFDLSKIKSPTELSNLGQKGSKTTE